MSKKFVYFVAYSGYIPDGQGRWKLVSTEVSLPHAVESIEDIWNMEGLLRGRIDNMLDGPFVIINYQLLRMEDEE
jgi:hypothetical protein